MNTNANDTTKQQALGAIYRKYLTTIEGMTREQAKTQSDKGCPYSAEQLNQAIARKQKISGSNAKPESNKEKTLDDYLTPEQVTEARRLVAQGIRGNTLKLYCIDLFKIRDKAILQAIVTLLDVKVTRTGSRGDSFDDKLNAFCKTGIKTEQQVREFIAEHGSKQSKKEATMRIFLARAAAFNAIHEMYRK
jgi:hypothetical protein